MPSSSSSVASLILAIESKPLLSIGTTNASSLARVYCRLKYYKMEAEKENGRILIGGTLWHAHYTLTEVKEGKKEVTRILTSFLPLGDGLRRDST